MPTVSIHRRSRFDYLPKSLPNRELQKSEVMNLPSPAGQTIEVSYEDLLLPHVSTIFPEKATKKEDRGLAARIAFLPDGAHTIISAMASALSIRQCPGFNLPNVLLSSGTQIFGLP